MRFLAFILACSMISAVAAPEAAVAADTKSRKPKPAPKEPERDLKMNEGTMQAGGSITLDIASAGGASAVGFNVYPNIGYFVADRIELLAGLDLGLGQGYTAWGFDLGGRVMIDMGDPWGYVGVTGGYGSVSAGGGGVSVSVGGAAVTPMLGVILPVAKNVGVDLGTRVNIGIAGGTTNINVPIGFLGIDAYFK